MKARLLRRGGLFVGLGLFSKYGRSEVSIVCFPFNVSWWILVFFV